MQDAENISELHAQPDFRPGFRLGVFDCVVLCVGGIAAYFAFTLGSLAAAIPAYVIFTFFLYCNVFRIRRTPELIWAAAFTLTALASFYFQQPTWIVVFAVGIAFTIILIVIEMRHPSYHGVFWRSLNPHLPTWWEQHQSRRP
jgi:hypothetical protein